MTDTTLDEVRSRSDLADFKVCPVCASLNVTENSECFVCRWHGSFDHSRELVRLKLYEVVRGRPDFWDMWASLPATRMQSRWERFVSRLYRAFRGRTRLDLRV